MCAYVCVCVRMCACTRTAVGTHVSDTRKGTKEVLPRRRVGERGDGTARPRPPTSRIIPSRVFSTLVTLLQFHFHRHRSLSIFRLYARLSVNDTVLHVVTACAPSLAPSGVDVPKAPNFHARFSFSLLRIHTYFLFSPFLPFGGSFACSLLRLPHSQISLA